MSRSRRSLFLTLILSVLLGQTARAEVGVSLAPNGDVLETYVLAVLTDDSSPIPRAASRASRNSQSRTIVNLDQVDPDPLATVTDDPDIGYWMPYSSGGEAIVGLTDDGDPIGLRWSLRSSLSAGVRVALNANGSSRGDGAPAVSIDPSTAAPIVVWARKAAAGYDIVASAFLDGAWTEPQSVAATPAPELDPQIAIDPSTGEVHVVYWIDGHPSAVYHTKAQSDLSNWSMPEVVSGPDEIALRPSVAFREGVLLIAYESHSMGAGSTPRQIVLASRAASGFESRVLASTYYAGANRPIVHSVDENLWLDWVDSNAAMAWTRLDGPSWSPLSFEDYSGVSDREFFVRSRIRDAVLEGGMQSIVTVDSSPVNITNPSSRTRSIQPPRQLIHLEIMAEVTTDEGDPSVTKSGGSAKAE